MKKIISCFLFLITTFLFAEKLENSLISAVNNEDYETVVSLLKSGANPNGDMTAPLVISPLGLACNKGNINIVRILLKNGANPNYKPKENSSPYFYTVMGAQQAEIMQLLIDYGLKVNYIESGKDHYAFSVITLGHSETLKVLVEAGLNTNIKNKDGYTLAEWAKKVGRKDCLDIIERKNIIGATNEEVTLTSYDKLCYHMTHSINDNNENTIYLYESFYIPKETLKVVAQVPYYAKKRYLVQFKNYTFAGAFIIETELNESLNVTYNGFINQNLRICLKGYGVYTDNGVEIQTYRFGIDTREIKKN